MNPLTEKMYAIAAGHPRVGEIIKLADEFEAAANGYWADPQTVSVKKFIGAWARARRMYSEISGESLV